MFSAGKEANQVSRVFPDYSCTFNESSAIGQATKRACKAMAEVKKTTVEQDSKYSHCKVVESSDIDKPNIKLFGFECFFKK